MLHNFEEWRFAGHNIEDSDSIEVRTSDSELWVVVKTTPWAVKTLNPNRSCLWVSHNTLFLELSDTLR